MVRNEAALRLVPLLPRGAERPVPGGDFGAAVEDGMLVLPGSVFEVFAAYHARTADDLLGYAETFPTAVATGLGWSASDVIEAAEGLRALLQGAGCAVPEPAVARDRAARELAGDPDLSWLRLIGNG